MTVQDVMDRVSILYNDADFERVSTDMYLKFLDDALLQLVLARPDSHIKTAVVQLDSGTRQTLPAEAFSLIDIYRNKGTAGYTDGSPIWQVNRKDLDYFADWHATPTVAPTEVTEFSYDVKSPKTYWVSPAPVAGTNIFVEMDYSYAFTTYAGMAWNTALTQVIDCDDVFLGPIVSYMLYLLYNTDAASQYDKSTAEQYKQTFYNQLGLEYKASVITTPVPGDTIQVNVQEGK